MKKAEIILIFFVLIFVSCVTTPPARETLGGIGVMIRRCEQKIFIVGIIDKNPASNSNIKIGDEIVEINGKAIRGMNLSEVLKLMRGEVGTNLNLNLERNSKKLDVSIKRDEIKVPPYKKMMLDGRIGYIKFYSNSLNISDIKQIYTWFYNNSAKAVIIDFRNFRGFRNFKTDLYIMKIYSEGKSLGYAQAKSGERIELTLKEKTLQPLTPLAIIVNNNTGGGGEIITLALKEYGMAYVIGNRTKGNTYTIKKSKKTPTHMYISPNGVNIHGKGIIPDKLIVTEECTFLDDSVIEMASNYLVKAMKK